MVGVETPARSAICWSVIRLDPGFTRPFLPLLTPVYGIRIILRNCFGNDGRASSGRR